MVVDIGGGIGTIVIITLVFLIILSIILSIFLRKIILTKLLKINNQTTFINTIYYIISNLILIFILYITIPKLVLWLLKSWLSSF